MRYFGCSINKLTSVLIRPGAVVRVHNGPLQIIISPKTSFKLLNSYPYIGFTTLHLW
jgi:hypothetical protein